MDAAKGGHLADLAAGDQVARKDDHRIVEIGEANRGRQPRHRGGGGHRLRLRDRRRQRLFAIDRLAGLKRGDRDRRMKQVRGGDRDHVDRYIGDRLAPVAACLRDTERGSRRGRGGQVAVGEDRDARRARQVEGAVGGCEGQRMGAAHEAAADQRDIQWCVAHSPATSRKRSRSRSIVLRFNG